MESKSLFIKIGDIKVKIITNSQDYHRYLTLHFSKIIIPLSDASSDIEVNAQWVNSKLKLNRQKGQKKIAANTLLSPRRITTIKKIGKRKKVKLNFELSEKRLTVSAQALCKPFKDTVRYKILGASRESLFFEFTYSLVYYPVFWYLAYFHKTFPIHASAVEVNNKGIIICGLEGIGKTTLSLLLVQELGARFISDNLIFYNRDFIYPCYEPIRIHKNEDPLLWKSSFRKINQFKTLKDFYEPIEVVDKDSKPNLVIFPVFGDGFSHQDISRDISLSRILNINDLTQELGGYNEYFHLLNLLDLNFNFKQQEQKTLINILNSTRCLEVTMDKAYGPKDNFRRLKEIIK